MHEVDNIDDLQQSFLNHKAYFNQHSYPTYDERVQSLKKLKSLVLENQQKFVTAMSDDFGYRCHDDSLIGDILTTVSAINYQLKHLKGWMKPAKKHVGILFQPAKAEVLYQPKCVVGIIAPWNYPLFLSLGPLATSIAAGNCAMIKMSEFTPNTNALLAELLAKDFTQNEVTIVVGESEIAQSFSELKFDHLFFTGSTQVGSYVMQAAAKNLVPVTLELGGKSPAIIAEDMPIEVAVKRFILGKTLNAGQTCVAPDYVFCPSGKVDELVECIKHTYRKMFPEHSYEKDTTCVVNEKQYLRLQGLVEDAKSKGAEVIQLTSKQSNLRQMPLTLLLNVSNEMAIMKEEIFGPILPVIEYNHLDFVFDYIRERERPLALYLYSFDKALIEKVKYKTHAGGVCINDAAFHVANDDLPFGGIGESGMGSYHGKEGFLTFSHAKSVFSRGKISLAPMLFPPFGQAIHKLVYKLFIR